MLVLIFVWASQHDAEKKTCSCCGTPCVQDLMASLSKDTDASGNPILGDIGVHLTKEVIYNISLRSFAFFCNAKEMRSVLFFMKMYS